MYLRSSKVRNSLSSVHQYAANTLTAMTSATANQRRSGVASIGGMVGSLGWPRRLVFGASAALARCFFLREA